MITNRFPYSKIKRKRAEGKRLYDTESGYLPSVTTVLGATKPDEDKQALQKWRNRVGEAEAQQITNEAANVGTLMHKNLEDWLIADSYTRKDNMIHRIAGRMADTIIKNINSDLDEVWGTEVNLYYPGLYAGTTDLVGVWKGKQTICDFKQTNKPKKREWITDYFLQGCLYAAAHNELFDTEIKSVAIFMCSRDCQFQLFEITDNDFEYYSKLAAERIEKYYQQET